MRCTQRPPYQQWCQLTLLAPPSTLCCCWEVKHQPRCWDTKHVQVCTTQEQQRDDSSKGGIMLTDIYGAGLRVCVHKVIVHA